MRTTVGSQPSHSAIPPQTPAIILCLRERRSGTGPLPGSMLSVIPRRDHMRSSLRGQLRVPPLQERRSRPGRSGLVPLGPEPLHLRWLQQLALGPGSAIRLGRRCASVGGTAGSTAPPSTPARKSPTASPKSQTPDVEHVGLCTDSRREVKELRGSADDGLGAGSGPAAEPFEEDRVMRRLTAALAALAAVRSWPRWSGKPRTAW